MKLILCQDFQYEELTDVLCCIFHTVLCLCRVLCPSKVQDKQLREFLLSQNIIIIFLHRHNKQIKFSRLLKFNEGDLIKYQIDLTFAEAQVSDMGESRWVETHTLTKQNWKGKSWRLQWHDPMDQCLVVIWCCEYAEWRGGRRSHLSCRQQPSFNNIFKRIPRSWLSPGIAGNCNYFPILQIIFS